MLGELEIETGLAIVSALEHVVCVPSEAPMCAAVVLLRLTPAKVATPFESATGLEVDAIPEATDVAHASEYAVRVIEVVELVVTMLELAS